MFALTFASKLAHAADKVTVLPFAPVQATSKGELAEARRWAREAARLRGFEGPGPSETLSAEMAVKDGTADTSDEYRAAGRASGAKWTVSGRVERVDIAPQATPNGQEDGYTYYRLELEACQVDTGRVESLTRDVDADDAPNEIAEMLALLLRPEGIANAELPWSKGPHKPKPKPKPVAPPPPPPPPPAAPKPSHAYAEGHPFAIGPSIGISNALARPEGARGPSWAMPVGGAFGYALAQVPGLELRGVFTSQVIGPRALEMAAGARYAIGVAPSYRVFIGPELLAGAHVALGADKTARFLAHGAAFAAVGIGEHVQVEIAGDLAAALGGSGTLLLGGGTTRALVRF